MSGNRRPAWYELFREFMSSDEVSQMIIELIHAQMHQAAARGVRLDAEEVALATAISLAMSFAWHKGREALLEEMGLAGLGGDQVCLN